MNDYILTHLHKTPIGEFIIGVYNNKLCLLDHANRDQHTSRNRNTIDKRLCRLLKAEMIALDNQTSNPIINRTSKQLSEYLRGERKSFDIPLITAGTEFQEKVWQALLDVPYGKTISYLELASNINNKKAVRAVASAVGANAMSVIVPCHRIIASNGGLGGYAGGLETKKSLLALEAKHA